MSWERQLLSMIDEDHCDPEGMADLSVAYAAEMGDESFIKSVSVLSAIFMFPLCIPSVYEQWFSWSVSEGHRYVGRNDSSSYARRGEIIWSVSRSSCYYTMYSTSNDEQSGSHSDHRESV